MTLQSVLANHSRLYSLSLSALLRHAKICWESDGVSRARGMPGRVMTSHSHRGLLGARSGLIFHRLHDLS